MTRVVIAYTWPTTRAAGTGVVVVVGRNQSVWNKRQGSLRNIKHFGIRRAVGYAQLE